MRARSGWRDLSTRGIDMHAMARILIIGLIGRDRPINLISYTCYLQMPLPLRVCDLSIPDLEW